MTEELRQQREVIPRGGRNMFIASLYKIVHRRADQCANGCKALVRRSSNLIRDRHIAKRSYKTRRPFGVLGLFILQLPFCPAMNLSHLPDEHIGSIVIGPGALLRNQRGHHRITASAR